MPISFQPLTFEPVNFSLTAGTNIPAPLDSPPRTPTSDSKNSLPPLAEEESSNDESTAAKAANGPLSPTSSHPEKKRPSGVRKFLRLRSIRDRAGNSPPSSLSSPPPTGKSKFSYESSGQSQLSPGLRPGSPLTTNTVLSGDSSQSLRRKRSTGWFGSAASRRKSALFVGRVDEGMANGAANKGNVESEAEKKRRMGPPPPTIPEFKTLGSDLDGGNLDADDLFKDIK